MKELGVLFSPPMVSAINQGRKTQTRRLESSPLAKLKPGDVIWVKETWRTMQLFDELKPTDVGARYAKSVYGSAAQAPIQYEVDKHRRCWRSDDERPAWCPGKLRPSLLMPRFAARTGLRVTDVRFEPIQEISAVDAIAEGVELESADPPFYYVPGITPHSLTGVGVEEPGGRHAERCYEKLWRLLHQAEGQRWEDNPRVVAISFERAWLDN